MMRELAIHQRAYQKEGDIPDILELVDPHHFLENLRTCVLDTWQRVWGIISQRVVLQRPTTADDGFRIKCIGPREQLLHRDVRVCPTMEMVQRSIIALYEVHLNKSLQEELFRKLSIRYDELWRMREHLGGPEAYLQSLITFLDQDARDFIKTHRGIDLPPAFSS